MANSSVAVTPGADVAQDEPSCQSSTTPPIADFSNLIRRCFLVNKEDEHRLRTKIVEAIDNCDG